MCSLNNSGQPTADSCQLTGIDEIPQRLPKTPFSADTPPICYATDLIHFFMALEPRSVLSLSLTISDSGAVSLTNFVPREIEDCQIEQLNRTGFAGGRLV